MIRASAPGKIHLLGEHSVVYGKPALLAAVDLRVNVTVIPARFAEATARRAKAGMTEKLQKIIEPIVKQYLKITAIPPYRLSISSQIPIGAGLGSSAAVSAAYIAALLSFLKVKWDLNLINKLVYESEKVFHGNPSGGDNSTVVYGGLIWFRKETPDLKIIQPLNFTIPSKIAKNFILINTGKPEETTKEMVEMVSEKFNPSTSLRARVQSAKFKKIFDQQEQLTIELLSTIQNEDENRLIAIIRAGEKNLESIGVVSPFAKSIIRKIEKNGGAAKICGAGGKTGPTGILLCYHPNISVIKNIANSYKLDYIKTDLGVEGLRQE